MDSDKFRRQVREYIRAVGQSQKGLANQLGLHPSVLSHKLNGTDNTALTVREIKQIIIILAEWQAITTQSEALALLTSLDLRYTSFSSEQWNKPPLSQLIKLPNTELDSGGVKSRLAALSATAFSNQTQTKTYKHNLPAQPTALIGRERETDAACNLLRRNDVRLLTFTGFGGTGKTRLSLQVASKLLPDFADGVFFVPLAAITEPPMVTAAIAQTLEINESGSKPLFELVKEYLRDKQLLLVLDNFEQVLVAASLVGELLNVAPALKLLVTSRAVLHLYGEYEFSVPTLGLPNFKMLPPLEKLTGYEAIRLFVERSRAVRPDFEVTQSNAAAIVEICSRLDGLPLAIELAAARSKLFNPPAMLNRLGSRLKLLVGGNQNLPVRHQTLRNTLDWSYKLLDVSEQRLFRRLAIFTGGCTLDSAEAVCNSEADNNKVTVSADDLPEDTFNYLTSLLDKSMLNLRSQTNGEPRFVMLETIREYALERLIESDEETLMRQRYATYFLTLAQQAKNNLGTPDQIRWLERLEAEHENLQAVLEGCHQNPKATLTGLRLAVALGWFWDTRGYLSEGRYWLDEFIKQNQTEDPDLQASGWLALGNLAYASGNNQQACDFFEQSVVIWRKLGDKAAVVSGLNNLGAILTIMGNYDEAQKVLEENLAINQELDDKQLIAFAYINLGILLKDLGDYPKSYQLYQQGLTVLQELGDKLNIASILSNMGDLVLAQNDYTAAHKYYSESLALRQELGDKRGITKSTFYLGQVAQIQSDYTEAHRLYQASLNLSQESGDKNSLAQALNGLGELARLQGDYIQAIQFHFQSLSLQQSVGVKYSTIEAIENLVVAWLEQEATMSASLVIAQLLGATAALRQQFKIFLTVINQPVQLRIKAFVAQHQNIADWNAALAVGQNLTLEQTVELALANLAPLT